MGTCTLRVGGREVRKIGFAQNRGREELSPISAVKTLTSWSWGFATGGGGRPWEGPSTAQRRLVGICGDPNTADPSLVHRDLDRTLGTPQAQVLTLPAHSTAFPESLPTGGGQAHRSPPAPCHHLTHEGTPPTPAGRQTGQVTPDASALSHLPATHTLSISVPGPPR